MRRPPIPMLLGPQFKSKESGDSLEHVLHNEKVNKTLAECLQLTEQVCSLFPTKFQSCKFYEHAGPLNQIERTDCSSS